MSIQKTLFAACFFVLFAFLSQAHAQGIPAILTGGCGTANYTSGVGYLTVDPTGILCTSSGGGGGGGAITMASGAVASGAYSAGSFAAGAGANGWDATQGSTTDAPCTLPASATACTMEAVAKAAANAVNAPTGSTGSTAPTKASLAGAVSSGNLVGIIQADNSAPINISTATTTQLVALSSGKKIYVTSWDVIAAGAGNITLEYGTGTACATGTTALTGAYNLAAQAGVAKGSGLGPVLVVPAGNALCALTSAAVQYSGSVAYTQF